MEASEQTEKPHNWLHYVNPSLGGLMVAIKLDKRYVRGEGCYLFDHEGVRYLDFLAGYGAIPFGYHPKELWEVLHQVELQMEPTFSIPSFLEAAGDLAAALIALCPKGIESTDPNDHRCESHD